MEDWGRSGENWIVTALQLGTTQMGFKFYRNESGQQREGPSSVESTPHVTIKYQKQETLIL